MYQWQLSIRCIPEGDIRSCAKTDWVFWLRKVTCANLIHLFWLNWRNKRSLWKRSETLWMKVMKWAEDSIFDLIVILFYREDPGREQGTESGAGVRLGGCDALSGGPASPSHTSAPQPPQSRQHRHRRSQVSALLIGHLPGAHKQVCLLLAYLIEIFSQFVCTRKLKLLSSKPI